MTTLNTKVTPLPFGVVGGKRAVYETLQEMAAEQAETENVSAGEVYFRKADLAQRVGLSPSRLQVTLRWLQGERYLDYEPGNPGRLSRIVFQDSRDEVSSHAS